MFTIEQIKRVSPGQVLVRVKIPAKEWTRRNFIERDSVIITIHNEVFAKHGISPYNRTIDDKKPIKNGHKIINIYYIDETWKEPMTNNVIYVDFKKKKVS